MLDDSELEVEVRVLIYELMMVLYRHGITEIHVGGFMRILGVADITAQTHDQERIILDENFVKYVDQINEPRPTDQLLH
jgi:hypothetical protein